MDEKSRSKHHFFTLGIHLISSTPSRAPSQRARTKKESESLLRYRMMIGSTEEDWERDTHLLSALLQTVRAM